MFVRKEYSIDDNNLNNNNQNTVFEDNTKKYLVDPFNNLIKDELKFHHNIRIYNTANFNKFKIIDVDHDMKDKIMFKKGILKDIVVCTRPLHNIMPNNDNIEFNIKIFGINLNSLVNNLKVDMLLDQDVSIENVINKAIKFEIMNCILFQNTNIIFIEVVHNDLKYLLIYDLINRVLLKDENNKVVKLEHQKVLYFENDNKKRIFGIINKNIVKKYKIKSNQHDMMFLKSMSVNFEIPKSKNIYARDDLYLCVNEKDENELIIFETDLINQHDMYFLKAENNKIYNANMSNNKNMILTTSKNGTNIKLYTKKTNNKYELYKIFKRGMNNTLNYLLGFSNDDYLIYSLSYNRTLHLYGLDDISRSIHVMKLSSRISDDVCSIKIMRDYNSEKYYIYVMWRHNGTLEMYSFDMKALKSKKIAYVEMY
ncbi:hypothetical protein FOG51_01490 [Hanseniaspora uvarum]|nr:hypothetical protein FOG48_01737 [Hanseniaspora uvarum]KAF0273454.1 hypothetical protein FOG51_01490 [Hanseniaspora uvarum]